MSNTQQPGKPRISRDVEEADTDGNRFKGAVEESDTEGNMPRVRWVAPAGEDGDDTEGSGRHLPPQEPSDTEGNGARFHPDGRTVGEDDTEANRFRGI